MMSVTQAAGGSQLASFIQEKDTSKHKEQNLKAENRERRKAIRRLKRKHITSTEQLLSRIKDL